MNDILAYLKDKQAVDDPVYQALLDTLKAFDTGLLLQFLYSGEDVEYSQVHGDLPEGAVPLEIALKHSPMASHTGGTFAEPWYIAQRLRQVADFLDDCSTKAYESALREARMQSQSMNVAEAQVNKIPQLQKRAETLAELLGQYDTEWNGTDDQAGRKDAEAMTVLTQTALDLGVPMPVTESHADLMKLYENLGDLIHDELQATQARIARAEGLKEQLAAPSDDPDGFAEPDRTGDEYLGAGPAMEDEEEKGLFD